MTRPYTDIIGELEDQAISIRWQNIGLLWVMNVVCWHSVTTHDTGSDAMWWVIMVSLVILCRDFYMVGKDWYCNV